MKNSNTPKCSIENCDRAMSARGWCKMHYQRWYKNGDPMNPGKYASHRTPEESFAARTEGQGDCIVWTGHKYGHGYGSIWVDGKNVAAHRYAWERANGPIPDGMQVDHICWNPSCVKTEHLRVATPSQNNSHLSGRESTKKSPGPRNVYPARNGWRVIVTKNGKQHYFGAYDSIEEAAKVAEKARAELFREFSGKG